MQCENGVIYMYIYYILIINIKYYHDARKLNISNILKFKYIIICYDFCRFIIIIMVTLHLYCRNSFCLIIQIENNVKYIVFIT